MYSLNSGPQKDGGKSSTAKPWSNLIHMLHSDSKGRGPQQRRSGAVAQMQHNAAACVTDAVMSRAGSGSKALPNGSAATPPSQAAPPAAAGGGGSGVMEPPGTLTKMGSGLLAESAKLVRGRGDEERACPVSLGAPSPAPGAPAETVPQQPDEADPGAAADVAVPEALATWSRGDWLMMAKCLEAATSDSASGENALSLEDKSLVHAILQQLLAVLDADSAAITAAVASCTLQDWQLVNKAMEYASKHSSLSIGEKAHARILLEMLVTTESDFQPEGTLRRNLSVSSASSDDLTGGDLAREWARQVARNSASNASSCNASHSGSPANSGKFPRVPDGANGSASNSGRLPLMQDFGPGDFSSAVHELKAVQTEVLEGALLPAVTMCSQDKTVNGSAVCNFLLDKALAATESTMGFISSLHFRPNGQAYLKTHAMTNVAWTPQLRKFFDEKKDSGLVFSNLNTLVGAIVKTGRLVLTNDTSADPRSSGVPPGHPKIQAFMGMPLYLHDKLIGAIAVANRGGGYTEEMADQMQTFNEVVAEIVGHYLMTQQDLIAEGGGKRSAASAQTAKNAVMSFNGAGCLSTMDKAAASIFGNRVGEHMSSIFFVLGNGELGVSPAGLELAASAGRTIHASGPRKNGQLGQFEMLVTRGFSEASQFVVSLWEAPSGQAGATMGARGRAGSLNSGGQPDSSASPTSGASGASTAIRRRSFESTGSSGASPRTPLVGGGGAECPVTTRKPEAVSQAKKQQMQCASLAFRAYEIYEADESPNGSMVAKYLLAQLLHVTESSMGLISSVHERPNGDPYLRTHAMTNVAWTRELRQWYEENWETGLIFSNMNSLVGSVVSPPYEPIITNNPMSDPRSTGVPPGHPVIRNFLGVPLFHGGELVGMWAVSNSKLRYSRGMLPMLEPLTRACADILGRILGHTTEAESASSEASSPGRSFASGRRTSNSSATSASRFTVNGTPASVFSEIGQGESNTDGSEPLNLEGLVVGLDLGPDNPHHTFPAEWSTDMGPEACPYLAHQNKK